MTSSPNKFMMTYCGRPLSFRRFFFVGAFVGAAVFSAAFSGVFSVAALAREADARELMPWQTAPAMEDSPLSAPPLEEYESPSHPMRLGPSGIDDGATQDIEGDVYDDAPPPSDAPPLDEEHVQIDSLQAVDPDSVGVLGADNGGFGLDMWSGTSRQVVEDLLPLLPADARSAFMRALMRRLLLSTATVPVALKTENLPLEDGLPGENGLPGDGPGAEPSQATSGKSLLSLRVRLLAAMGDFDAVGELLNVAPEIKGSQELLRTQADSFFLVNDHASACSLARWAVSEHRGDYWLKALIFCQALKGQLDQASIGLNLLREMGEGDDAIFPRVARSLLGMSEEDIGNLPDPTPLQLSMMRAANMKLPADVVLARNPAILRSIATSPNADLDIRLIAAERAEAAAVLSTEALMQIYDSVEFTAEELENALTYGESQKGPKGRAMLLRSAHTQKIPTAQAEVLLTLLGGARNSGSYGTVVRSVLPILIGIQPSAELVWFAEEAGRALFFAGRNDRAMDWYGLASVEAERIPDAARAKALLWPLAQIADKENTLVSEPGMVAKWHAALNDGANTSPITGDSSGVLLSIFDALDKPVNMSEWAPFLNPRPSGAIDGEADFEPSIPSAALWFGFKAASEELRLGETVLRALLCLDTPPRRGGAALVMDVDMASQGDADPASEAAVRAPAPESDPAPAGEVMVEEETGSALSFVHPVTLNEVTGRLRLIGLMDEARALAMEAAIATGL